MEIVEFNGWKNNARLANRDVELIVTKDIGPRIIRFGFIGGDNVFAEIAGQQGGSGEKEWMLRGGHRLWIAPEDKPKSYEPDNAAIDVEEIPNGVRTMQPVGPLTGVRKTMEITLAKSSNAATVTHILTNETDKPIECAPWALSAMARGGTAIIPLPEKAPHPRRLTHNQEWSLWGYTDFSDPRWTFGKRYILFRQDMKRGPNKLGIAHREGWVAYLVGGNLFVKRFAWVEGARYPDGGMNFETFSNEDMLEIESLGPLATIGPGESAAHVERWSLYENVPVCKTEADIEANVRIMVG